jgi:hypothetical protein
MAAVLFGYGSQASACEPVVPFMQVVGGPGLMMRSLIVLIGAIVLKCVAFAMFQKRISFLRAVLYMFVGNLVTTVIGVIAGAMIGSGSGVAWLIGLPIVWLFCRLPAERLIRAAPHGWFKNASVGGLASMMTGALVASCWLFIFAGLANETDSIVLYWCLKLLAIYVGLAISIVLTACWEEWIVLKFSRGAEQDGSFVVPTIRANLLVMVVVMAIGAALMLPKRLKSPDFLVREMAKSEGTRIPDAP